MLPADPLPTKPPRDGVLASAALGEPQNGQVPLKLKAQDMVQHHSAADQWPASSKSRVNRKGRSNSNRLHQKPVLCLTTETQFLHFPNAGTAARRAWSR